jgi:hypothetical protein
MEVRSLINVCDSEKSRDELKRLLNLKNDEHFRKTYIKPAIQNGFLEMTIPHKPNSRLQKYRLTTLGKELKESEL